MRTAHTHTRVCMQNPVPQLRDTRMHAVRRHTRTPRTRRTRTRCTRTGHTHSELEDPASGATLSGKDVDRAPPGPDAPSLGTRRPPLAVTWPPRRHRGRTAGLHPSAGQGPGQATSALGTVDPTGAPRQASWYRVTCGSVCPSRQGPPALPRARDGVWGCRARQTPPASAAYRWEREEGDGEDGEAGGDGLPDPGLRHLVPVADGGDRDLSGRDGGQQSRFQGLWTGVCPA